MNLLRECFILLIIRPTAREREISRQRMEKSYKEVMEAYAEQQKELSKRPKWIPSKTKGAVEPSELMVTNVNQTKKLVVSLCFQFNKNECAFNISLLSDLFSIRNSLA